MSTPIPVHAVRYCAYTSIGGQHTLLKYLRIRRFAQIGPHHFVLVIFYSRFLYQNDTVFFKILIITICGVRFSPEINILACNFMSIQLCLYKINLCSSLTTRIIYDQIYFQKCHFSTLIRPAKFTPEIKLPLVDP